MWKSIRPVVLTCQAMSETDTETRPPRKQRSDGERSRNAILHEAARLATVEGIDGLSIARLADAVGMSKSGLFAHFGSKEELQLATIETAGAIFAERGGRARLAAPTGYERLAARGGLPAARRGTTSFPAAASSRRSRPSSTPVPGRCTTAR